MITVDINKATLMAQLTAAVSRIKMEVRKATHEVGKHLKAKVQEAFDVGGPGWAPLSDFTLVKKWQAGQTAKPLVATGKYRRSQKITIKSWKSGFLGPGAGGYPRGRSLVRVAMWHEEGTRNMPFRQVYAPVAKREADAVARIYHEAIVRALGGL